MTITVNMSITPEQTTITASDNTIYAGSLTGFSVGGFISGCNINNTTLNVAMSQGFIGGLGGYMYNAEIRGTKQSKINVNVTDTDNEDEEGTSTEIQPLGEPSDMFQQMFESNDNKPTNDNKTRGGLEAVGGMAGRMDSSNIHSASLENYNILAENTYNVGGVIGFLYESELVSNEVKSDLITDVADQEEVYGIIRGKSYIGGIAGRVFNSNINNNNVSSNLIHGENYVGGLIGHLVTYGHKADTQEYSNIPFSSYIRSSNNLARRVEGVNHVGGYIGSLFNSYATPTISWNANQITQKVTATGELLGGFIGDIEYGCDDLVTISNINNNINTIETMSSENGDQITGGLIGQVKRNEGYNNCHIQTQLDPDTFLSINELTIPVNINGAHFDYTIKDDGVEVIKRILTQILNSIAESIVNSNVSDVISINSLRHEIQTLKGVDQVGGLIGHIEDHTVSNSNVAVLGMNMYIGYMTGEQKPGGLVGTIDHTLDESDPKDSDRKTFTVGSSNIIINFDKNKGDQYAEFISQMSGKVGMNFQCIYSFFPSMSTNESTLEHTIPLSNLSNDSFNIELDYIEGLPDNLIDAPAGEDASYETLKDTIYIEPKSVTILSESHKTGIKNKISAIIQNKLTNLTAPEIAQLSEKLGLSLTDAVALANKDYSVLANYNLMSIFTEQDEQDMLSDEYFKSSVRDLEVLLQLIRKGAYSYKSGDDDFYISSNYLTFGRLNRPSYYYSGLSKCVIQHLLSTPTNPEAYKKCLDAAQVPMNKAGVVMLYIDALNMVNNSICYYTDLGSIINMSGAIIQKDNNHEPLTEPIPLVFSIETPVLPLRSGENNDNTETNPETPDTPDTPDTPVPGE